MRPCDYLAGSNILPYLFCKILRTLNDRKNTDHFTFESSGLPVHILLD